MIIEITFNDKGDRVGKLHDDWDQVPKNPPTGLPVNTTVRGTYIPTLTATESGWGVQLGVEFTSGNAWFRDIFSGNIRPPEDLTGWKWSIPARVGFAEILNESGNNIDLVPQVVQDQLKRFTSQGFLVSRIFCDLQNIDILGTDAAVATTDPGTKDVYKSMFSMLLADWLGHVKRNALANPYILGYVPSHPPSADPDPDVPDSLKPVGNTFNVFCDRGASPRSTLNFILNTRSSALPTGTHPPTDIFDSSWLSPTDICDGKMTYSFRSLVETMVLRAFYDTYSKSIHEQITGGGIVLDNFRTYDNAKNTTDAGYSFDIYDVRDGLDQCRTYFDVSFSTTSQGISIDLAGYIYWYKEKRKDVDPLGTARAWAGGEMTWKASIPITLRTNGGDPPKLEVTPPTLDPKPLRTWHDANRVAKDLGIIEDLIGDIIKVGGFLLSFSTNEWLVAGVFGLEFLRLPSLPTVKGIPLNLALEAWSKTLSTAIILPAGEVFWLKQLSADSRSGVVSMLVDYK